MVFPFQSVFFSIKNLYSGFPVAATRSPSEDTDLDIKILH